MTPVTRQSLLSMGFSQQEYWSGLPFPPLGGLPTQRSNSYLLHLLHWQANSLLLSHWRGPLDYSSFALSFEITKYKFSNFVLLYQDCISDYESFAFRNKYKNKLVKFRKKKKKLQARTLIWIAVSL